MATKMTAKRNPDGSAVTYKWHGGGFNGASAQEVGEELARLEVRPGDFHRTPDVLDEARNPDSPLHRCFEWNDDKAAEAHRLHQCRAMLRSIAVVIVRGEKREKRRLYCHITDEQGPKYVRSDRVASEESVRRAALDEALAMLNGLRRRFEFLQELSPVFEAMQKINKRKKK